MDHTKCTRCNKEKWTLTIASDMDRFDHMYLKKYDNGYYCNSCRDHIEACVYYIRLLLIHFNRDNKLTNEQLYSLVDNLWTVIEKIGLKNVIHYDKIIG